MRILFIAPYPLSRLRIRSYGFVRHLAQQHDVTLLVLSSNKQEARDVQALHDEGITVTAIEDKFFWKIMRVLRSFLTRRPLQVAFDASPRLMAEINRCLQGEKIDLIHIEFIRALGSLPNNITIPVVWDAVDCISRLYEYGAKYKATVLLRMIGKIEARRTRMYEQQQLYKFHTILVTSQRDQLALLELAKQDTPTKRNQPLARIIALPHGIDQNYYQPYEGERQSETLVFSGKMSFHANVAGALYLAKAIMPLIWSRHPNVRLVIAGSRPPKDICRLALDTRIEVTGFVPDLRPIIGQAMVAVCPLPYAVGIQNKVLEAMALGTPVVASSHAVGGLEIVADQDALVTDEPELFADAVLRLLDDQVLWQKLSKNGQTYISRYHDWTAIIEKLATIYSDAIEGRNEQYLQEAEEPIAF